MGTANGPGPCTRARSSIGSCTRPREIDVTPIDDTRDVASHRPRGAPAPRRDPIPPRPLSPLSRPRPRALRRGGPQMPGATSAWSVGSGASGCVLFRAPARVARADSPLGLPGVSPAHRGPAGAPGAERHEEGAAPGAPCEIRHPSRTPFSPATFLPARAGLEAEVEIVGSGGDGHGLARDLRDVPGRKRRLGTPRSRLRSARRPRHCSGQERARTVAAGLGVRRRVRREETPPGVTRTGGPGLRGRMPGAAAGSGREVRGAGRTGRTGPARRESLGDPGPSCRRTAATLEVGWRRLRVVAAPAFGIAAGPAFALAGLHRRASRRFDGAQASRSPCASLRTRRRPKSGAASRRGPGIGPRHAPVFRAPWTDCEIGRMVSSRFRWGESGVQRFKSGCGYRTIARPLPAARDGRRPERCGGVHRAGAAPARRWR